MMMIRILISSLRSGTSFNTEMFSLTGISLLV